MCFKQVDSMDMQDSFRLKDGGSAHDLGSSESNRCYLWVSKADKKVDMVFLTDFIAYPFSYMCPFLLAS